MAIKKRDPGYPDTRFTSMQLLREFCFIVKGFRAQGIQARVMYGSLCQMQERGWAMRFSPIRSTIPNGPRHCLHGELTPCSAMRLTLFWGSPRLLPLGLIRFPRSYEISEILLGILEEAAHQPIMVGVAEIHLQHFPVLDL